MAYAHAHENKKVIEGNGEKFADVLKRVGHKLIPDKLRSDCMPGYVTLVNGMKPAMSRVKKLEKEGYNSLVVTHISAEEVARHFGKSDVRDYLQVVASADGAAPRDMDLIPVNKVEHIGQRFGQLIARCKTEGKRAVVYVELERLIAKNGYHTVQEVLRTIQDAAQNVEGEDKPVIIASVNPKSLLDKDLADLRNLTYAGML